MNSARDNLPLALSAITFAVMLLSLGDAAVKFSNAEFSLWQMYVLRSAVAVVVLMPIILAAGHSLRMHAPGWVLLRSFLMVVVWGIFYIALVRVPFATAAAVFYTSPLFITLLSALRAGDKVGARTIFAVLCGFIGVVIIVRPTNFNGYALLPLLSAFLFAGAMLITRWKCQRESPLMISGMQNVMFIVVGLVMSWVVWIGSPGWALRHAFVFGGWHTLDAPLLWLLGGLGFIFAVANIFTAVAYQRGAAPAVATFDYTYLIFSIGWGLWLLSETPDIPALLGMTLITLAGILVLTARGDLLK